jgi:hypothetical protein
VVVEPLRNPGPVDLPGPPGVRPRRFHRSPGTQRYVYPSSAPSVAYRAFWQVAGLLGDLLPGPADVVLAVEVMAGLIPLTPRPIRGMLVRTTHVASLGSYLGLRLE